MHSDTVSKRGGDGEGCVRTARVDGRSFSGRAEGWEPGCPSLRPEPRAHQHIALPLPLPLPLPTTGNGKAAQEEVFWGRHPEDAAFAEGESRERGSKCMMELRVGGCVATPSRPHTVCFNAARANAYSVPRRARAWQHP